MLAGVSLDKMSEGPIHVTCMQEGLKKASFNYFMVTTSSPEAA